MTEMDFVNTVHSRCLGLSLSRLIVGRPSFPMKSTAGMFSPLMGPGVAYEPDPGGVDSGD